MSKRAFVTVGTTSFNELTQTLSSSAVLETLRDMGYSDVLIQYGRGEFEPHGTGIQSYRFKPSLELDFQTADLVISHAGSGSIFEALRQKKPLIVVVNEKLMDNHQLELAKALCEQGHLYYSTCSSLLQTLKDSKLEDLKPLPPHGAHKFEEMMEDFLGWKP